MNEAIPRVLAILPGFIPSTSMDVVQPLLGLEQLRKIEFTTLLEPYTSTSAINRADVVVFCRNTEPKYEHILDTVLNQQIPYIYDLDDNLFEVPLDTELGRYYRAPQRLDLLRRYLAHASLVRVYSKYMLNTVHQFGSPTEYVTAPIVWKYFRSPKPHHPHKRVKIVYATSRKEDTLSQIFLPALQRLLDEYPDKVEAYFWGFFPAKLSNMPNVHSLAPIQNYRLFVDEFSKRQFDIGLAPLIDDQFHRAKTNNKFREYSACGIAGVYSDVEVYSECITNGETGLLVPNEAEAWHAALVRLIEDQALRTSIGEKALAYSRKRYSEEQFQDTWWQQISIARDQKNRYHESPKQWEKSINHGTPVEGSKITQKSGSTSDRSRSVSPRKVVFTLRLQLQNLWMLFKINLLKRL